MIRRNRIVLGIVSLGLSAGLGYAIRARASGIPPTNALSYAGVLEDANGPITGTHNIQVVLYDAATAGDALCQSTSAAFSVVDGHFSVQLPDTCTAAVGANPNVWADVLVDGSDTGRTMIGAVPYAVEANHAVNADNATGTLAQQVVPSGAVMYFNLSACPAGWSDLTAGQGRYIVGMPSTGTLAGAVGTALTDEENRPVGQHAHAVTDPGHSHDDIYLINDYPAQSCPNGADGYIAETSAGVVSGIVGTTSASSICSAEGTPSAVTNVSVQNAGTTAGTNAPYIQLRVCQKN